MRDGDEGEEEEEEREEYEEDEETGWGVGGGDEDGISLCLQGESSAKYERGENRDAVGGENLGKKGWIRNKVHRENMRPQALLALIAWLFDRIN